MPFLTGFWRKCHFSYQSDHLRFKHKWYFYDKSVIFLDVFLNLTYMYVLFAFLIYVITNACFNNLNVIQYMRNGLFQIITVYIATKYNYVCTNVTFNRVSANHFNLLYINAPHWNINDYHHSQLFFLESYMIFLTFVSHGKKKRVHNYNVWL